MGKLQNLTWPHGVPFGVSRAFDRAARRLLPGTYIHAGVHVLNIEVEWKMFVWLMVLLFLVIRLGTTGRWVVGFVLVKYIYNCNRVETMIP